MRPLVLLVLLASCNGSVGFSDGPESDRGEKDCLAPAMCLPDGSNPQLGDGCSCGCPLGVPYDGERWCTEAGCLVEGMLCHGGGANDPEQSVGAPTLAEWEERTADLEIGGSGDNDDFPLAVDVEQCAPTRIYNALGFGSAWIEVVPNSASGECEIWLGGETEYPPYDGSPTMYCSFPRSCAAVLATHWGDGGPASIDSPYCTEPGFATR